MIKKHLNKVLVFIGVVFILSILPIVPVQVVPAITVRVVDTSGKPVVGLSVVQHWNHLSYENVDERHQSTEVSNGDGDVSFSEKRLYVSLVKFVLNWIGERTVGMIDIHGSYGVRSTIVVDQYKAEPFFQCWNECSKERQATIVAKDKIGVN